jgi:hypothetical protein
LLREHATVDDEARRSTVLTREQRPTQRCMVARWTTPPDKLAQRRPQHH